VSASVGGTSDAEFVEALTAGAEWAVEVVRQMVERRVRRFGKATALPLDAEDAAGDVLLALLECFRERDYPEPLRNPKGFIDNRIDWQLIDWTRRHGHRFDESALPDYEAERLVAEDAAYEDALARMLTGEGLDLLVRCLFRVDVQWRMAWMLRRLEIRRKCIAAVLGVTISQVRNWIHRTELSLRACPELHAYLAEG